MAEQACDSSGAELERVLKLDLDPSTVMLGINNRDLQTFKVDLQNNQRIMDSSAGQEVGVKDSFLHCILSACQMLNLYERFVADMRGSHIFTSILSWHCFCGRCTGARC